MRFVTVVLRTSREYSGGSFHYVERIEAAFENAGLAEQFILSRKTPEKFRSVILPVFSGLDGATLFQAPPEIEICSPVV